MKRKIARLEEENAILAQSVARIVKEKMKSPLPVFEFIKAHQSEFRVSTMCRVLPVSRSGYYAWLHRGPSRWEEADRRLFPLIKRIYEDSNGHYGTLRIQAVLRE
ncbi:MAG: transposase [Gammaproteobacteria bacterium]|nr:transposase [Gammaproteobacteria bacterium]MYF02461.1 transposase [Gammaproteobacteria bacterium]MYI76957.1 transposase [Gammaproteobacteria bacterium]